MIIFGYRGFAKILATLSLLCPNCHNPAAHHIVKRSRWFTLFFIPVIPMHISRLTQCTYCGHTAKISKADAEQLVGQADAPRPMMPPAAPVAAAQPYPQQPNQQPYHHQPYPQQQYPQP